jgi:hypothetical protein
MQGSQLAFGHAGPAVSEQAMREDWQLQWRDAHWSSAVHECPFR